MAARTTASKPPTRAGGERHRDLEAALFKRPMVIATDAVTVSAGSCSATASIPYIGLPNILAGEFGVSELCRTPRTPAALAGAL